MVRRGSEVPSKFWWPVGIAAVWTALYVGVGYASLQSDSSSSEYTPQILWASIFVWMGLGVAVGTFRALKQAGIESRADARIRDQQRTEREADAKRVRARISSLSDDLQSRIPSALIAQYDALVADLEQADSSLSTARRLLDKKVYSPFWEAIEDGLLALNSHRLGIEKLQELTRSFVSTRVDLENLDRTAAEQVESFPPNLDGVREIPVGERLASDFKQLAFQAQSDFQFASIYEQRRTTAAVLAGFASLNDAITRMGAAISASISSLGQGLDELNAHARSSAANSARLLEEVRDVRETVHRTNEIPYGIGSSHTVGGQIAEINHRLAAIGRH